MIRKRLFLQVTGLALTVLLLIACATSEPTATPAPPTVTAQPTPTLVPPTATPTSGSEMTPTPDKLEGSPEAGASWDYVALGDSIPAGWGVGGQSFVTYYAEYLEEDLGVTVNVNNKGVPGDTTEGLLFALRSFDELRDAISQAEVITIWIGLNDMWSVVLNPYRTSRCGNAENLDLDCVHEGTAELEANIDAILGEIVSLRSTNDTLIRIADNCNILVDAWKDTGVFEELKGPGFEDWSQAIVQAAAKYGIPVVHSHVALNGPDGDQPIPEEYLLDDGVHFNAEGHKIVADLHREIGYEYGGP